MAIYKLKISNCFSPISSKPLIIPYTNLVGLDVPINSEASVVISSISKICQLNLSEVLVGIGCMHVFLEISDLVFVLCFKKYLFNFFTQHPENVYNCMRALNTWRIWMMFHNKTVTTIMNSLCMLTKCNDGLVFTIACSLASLNSCVMFHCWQGWSLLMVGFITQ